MDWCVCVVVQIERGSWKEALLAEHSEQKGGGLQ